MSFVAFLALIVAMVAHVVLAGSLARRAPAKAVAAFVVPPLAPYWGYGFGFRRRVAFWWASVVVYALLVVVVAH